MSVCLARILPSREFMRKVFANNFICSLFRVEYIHDDCVQNKIMQMVIKLFYNFSKYTHGL